MTYTPAKHNLIFGKMSSVDFYPEGRDNEIDVIVAAPKETRIWPGEVVIMDKKIYSELLETLKVAYEKLKLECGGWREYQGGMPTQVLFPKIEAIITKAEGK